MHHDGNDRMTLLEILADPKTLWVAEPSPLFADRAQCGKYIYTRAFRAAWCDGCREGECVQCVYQWDSRYESGCAVEHVSLSELS